MTRPVPDDWTTDCDNCQYFLAIYDRKDLHLFEAVLWNTGEHVLEDFGAEKIPGAEEAWFAAKR